MLKSVRFQNLKGFKGYTVTLKQMNVLVGPNNAGKSTILDAFRILSASLRFARRRNQAPVSLHGEIVVGWDIPASSLPVTLTNIHSDYDERAETSLTFTLDNGARLRLDFEESTRCIMTVQAVKTAIRNTNQFRREIPIEIACMPTLGPLEEQEALLSYDYVERWQGSRLTHRMFRNIWYRNPGSFAELQALLEQTWPGMRVNPPERSGYAPPLLHMFCEENRATRELSWAGFGFQVWLQILTHLIGAKSASTIIVDEPEIYLHPDLQHRLFQVLRDTNQQVLLATHSVEIINEADHDDVVLVNRVRRTAKRVADIDGLQEAIFSIGSGQNIHLSKLSNSRKVLFFEGNDFKLIKRLASKLGLSALANDINLTVVQIGGFAQRQKIEDAAWTFEKILRAEIKIAALLDRDDRSTDEVESLLKSVRASVPNFHVLECKEIENYFLKPEVLVKAVSERLRERRNEQDIVTLVDVTVVEKILDDCTNIMKPDVLSQIISNKIRYCGSNRDPRDQSTITGEAIRAIETVWVDLSRRLRIVPGKQTLTDFNRLLEERFGVSVTYPQIARLMQPTDIADDMKQVLYDLDRFASA